MRRLIVPVLVVAFLGLLNALMWGQAPMISGASFGRFHTPATDTAFSGTAEKRAGDPGQPQRYEGNVVIKIPDARIAITSGSVMFDEKAKTLAFDGPVTIELDAK